MTDPASEFANQPVDPDSLPDYRDAPLQAIHPNYVLRIVIGLVIFWSLVIIAVLVGPRLPFVEIEPARWHWIGVLVLFAWSVLVDAWLDPRARGWAIRTHDLIYRYGVVWRKTVIVPFARIQHVEAINGPIERMLGLMRVKCFTAGGAGADLVVKGLAQRDARRVRQYLLEQIGTAEQGPDTSEAQPTDGEESGSS